MKCIKLPVTVDYEKSGITSNGCPELFAYIRDNSTEMPSAPRPAIVICPGGGYWGVSDREAEPIAIRFVNMGFQCFVLYYSVAANTIFPGALLELASSVATVRNHAEDWNIDPNKIIIAGFSAGGHLAASLGAFWDKEFVYSALNLNQTEIRPNGLILGYPVITSGEYAHRESFYNLLGKTYDKNIELVSLENQVTEKMPPVFMWHTYNDTCVPVENSLLFANSLKKYNIPLELHILPNGPHGLSLAEEETGMVQESCKAWTDWAARWIKNL